MHPTLQAEPQKVYINLKRSRVFPVTFRHPLLRTIAIFSAMANQAITAGSRSLVLFAQEILDLDDLGFGLLITEVAVGGLVGSLGATLLGATLRVGLVVLGGIACGRPFPLARLGRLSVPTDTAKLKPDQVSVEGERAPELVDPVDRPPKYSQRITHAAETEPSRFDR